MLINLQYGLVKRAENFWKGMSNNKTQISPIPPESYGDRFIKFISGTTMTREEQDRQMDSGEQLDGSLDVKRRASVPASRKSYENKVVEKAEKGAQRSEQEGATEDPQRDRTLSTMRSPSVERGGATLPVVEEDGEANSREDSVQDEKASSGLPNGAPFANDRPPVMSEKGKELPSRDQLPNGRQLPSIPNFNRLSLGLQSKAPSGSGS